MNIHRLSAHPSARIFTPICANRHWRNAKMYDLEIAVSPASDARRRGAGLRVASKQRTRARAPAQALLTDLIRVLAVERLEQYLFRGVSRDIGTLQVFGGQVIAQALAAACNTVEQRSVHSLHAYFLRRGDVNAPIIYQVERARDGASFSNRRVSATQHGAEILNLAVSFQSAEQGFEHQLSMPDVPPPESLPTAHMLAADSGAHMPLRLRKILVRDKPFEFRFVDPLHFMPSVESQCVQHLWFRAIGRLPDDACLHSCLLAYVSDYYLLSTAVRTHRTEIDCEMPPAISIDHAIWFHRPARVDDWLLYSIDSPNSAGARGFTRASIFARDGRLIASAAQEGLMRARDAARAPLKRSG
jgi:acyl-CoA thioesterase-2